MLDKSFSGLYFCIATTGIVPELGDINLSLTNKISTIMKTAIKYFFIYLGLYLLGAIAMALPAVMIEFAIKGTGFDPEHLSGWSMSLMILGSQLLPLYVFWKKKYCDLTFIKNSQFVRLLALMFVGWLGCYLLISVVQQYLPHFDWDVKVLSDIGDMATNPLGILAVCIMAPIVEECVFRGAIERKLLERDWNPWWAIVISALLFAVFHGNLAQGVTAFILGLFLGWVYYRTRNLWLCIFVHAVNNTWSMVGYFISGAKDINWEATDVYPFYVNLLIFVGSVFLLAVAVRSTGKTVDATNNGQLTA